MTTDSHRRKPGSLNIRFTIWLSWSTAALAVIALALGIAAVPRTGANCLKACVSYPYLDTAGRFPRDYLWIYAAILLVFAYLLFMISLRIVFTPRDEVFGQACVALAIAATSVLAATYSTQSSVVPASLAADETEGIALFTMYNPHGMFIALEEIGYVLMSASFFFAALMITGGSRLVRIVRWLFFAGLVIPILAFIGYSLAYGLDRQDRFEVVVLTTDWLVLFANGILIALFLRKQRQTQQPAL